MRAPSRFGSFLGANTTPGLLFATGAVVLPAFLMQGDLVVRALQLLLFLGLNALSGRRVRVLQFVVVAAGIIAANLVIPTGRVLLSPLGVPVTEGALKSGLFKATAMTGLIALSQFSIRSDLRLPGKIGGLIGRSLFYFEKIMGERRRIDRKDIIGSIDALLLEIQGAGAGSRSIETLASSSPRGIVLLAIIAAANWGAFALTVVYPRPFWGG